MNEHLVTGARHVLGKIHREAEVERVTTIHTTYAWRCDTDRIV